MSPAEFEALYRSDPDPWGYTSSDYERRKYADTLAACGPGPFGCALELGASIGVFSALLVPRCRELTTIDAAPTAVAAARARLAAAQKSRAGSGLEGLAGERERLAGAPRVTPVLGSIPEAIPSRPYDLVVASEILYYLTPDQLSATFAALRERLVAGGRLVAVHWRPAGPERRFSAAEVHDAVRALPWLRVVQSGGTSDYLLDVLERM